MGFRGELGGFEVFLGGFEEFKLLLGFWGF